MGAPQYTSPLSGGIGIDDAAVDLVIPWIAGPVELDFFPSLLLGLVTVGGLESNS